MIIHFSFVKSKDQLTNILTRGGLLKAYPGQFPYNMSMARPKILSECWRLSRQARPKGWASRAAAQGIKAQEGIISQQTRKTRYKFEGST
ncbi:hypothetical protein OSB04_030962 [Centaurea solstitialis]|uniref:Uncharacterized protein n=1 Tax=Centaurea solstitialis TaxID=347529 RepID=A0AA38S819_9ASTR|nr:hypothetical protein OSB04_030962 [Centaurea solstitialis]